MLLLSLLLFLLLIFAHVDHVLIYHLVIIFGIKMEKKEDLAVMIVKYIN